MKKKEYLKKFFLCWESVFLFIFMIGIFGPSEVFFGNYTELGVVYGEFGWLFFVVGFTISIIIAFVLVFFPEIIRKIILAVVWGLSIAGYIQVMFLNKGIDQIGVTAEGYIPDADRVIKNAVFWGAAIAITFVITFVCKKKYSLQQQCFY